MPFYSFQHSKSKEVVDIFFHMNDEKIYKGEYGNDPNWVRLYTVPQASFDTKIDPHDKNSFIEKTGKKKGTLGEINDLSAELSEKRAKNSDHPLEKVKEDYFNKWSEKRKFKVHPEDYRTASQIKKASKKKK